MLYFSNQELAEANHVSVRTVRNWIDSAREGKLELTLQSKGQRHYIANTSKNLQIIGELVNKNKKYRPHSSQKTVTPQPKFYELYTQEQLYDLVTNLEIGHEIPLQYNYFGDGAYNWDNYTLRLLQENSQNTLRATSELLESSQEYLGTLIEDYAQVNVIDIGVGNALPVKDFLTDLLAKKKLGRYIAVDMSPDMLDIAEKNIHNWFDDKIKFERYEADITHDRFGYLLSKEYIKSDSEKTCNLFLFLGGTISNFKKPSIVLDILHDSMGVNDFLIHSQKLDTPASRKYFDFSPVTPTGTQLAPHQGYIFDLLNINETLYDVEMGYSNEQSQRYIRVKLKVAVSIRFTFEGGERTISFNKGDKILLWRARQNSVLDVLTHLTQSEYHPLHMSQTRNKQFILTVSSILKDEE